MMVGLNYCAATTQAPDVSGIQALKLKDMYSQLKHAVLANGGGLAVPSVLHRWLTLQTSGRSHLNTSAHQTLVFANSFPKVTSLLSQICSDAFYKNLPIT